jgi:aquaporin Z
VGGWAVAQLWMFWVAPLLGGALAGVLYKGVFQREIREPAVTGGLEPGVAGARP